MNGNLICGICSALSRRPAPRWWWAGLAGALVSLAVGLLWPLSTYADAPTFNVMRFFGANSDDTSSVAVGDLDGDGDLDLIAGNSGWSTDKQNAVYLNDGTGDFSDTHDFGTGSDSTASVAVGDVDGDGVLDLVVGNDGEQNVVYLNDGAGDFYAGPVDCGALPENVRCFGTGSDDTQSVAVGDMNGDGALDVVVGNSGWPTGTQNVVYLNDGVGHFFNTSIYTCPFGTGLDKTLSVALGDMDGDSDLDIVVGNDEQQNSVYLNDGTGGFSDARNFGPGSNETTGIAVGDVDGDGALDIAVGNESYSQSNVVYLNDGGGDFYTGTVDCSAPPANVRCLGTGSDGTRSMAVGDADGDGDLDILTGNYRSGSGDKQNVVYLNDGVGDFHTGAVDCAALPIGVRCFGTGSDDTRGLAMGDVNGDGALDIIVGNYRNPYGFGQNVVYLSDGGGDLNTYRNFGKTEVPEDVMHVASVVVGDMNSDGHLDLVVGNDVGFGDGQNMIYLDDGTSHFYAGPVISCDTLPDNARCLGPGADDTKSVAVGDLDGDGDLDIVAGNDGQQNVVYLNDGAGGFSDTHDFGTGSDSTQSVAVGDVNGDGALDVVVGNRDEPNMICFNDGRAHFYTGTVDCDNPPQGIRCFDAGLANTRSVAVGDLNGDGALDIVAGNWGEPNQVYLNNVGGDFFTARTFGTGSDSTESVAVGDVDGNGTLDIIVGNYGQNMIFLNDGAGRFYAGFVNYATPPANVRCFGSGGDYTRGVAVGDVNGDGALDIVAGNWGESNAAYLNDGAGQFDWYTPARDFDTGYDWIWTRSVAVGDINGDGVLDVAFGTLGEINVAYLNRARLPERLANNALYLRVTRPITTDNANFHSSPVILDSQFIPVTYTIFDREGDMVGRVEASYSPDGGGRWLPAVATTDTITTNLSLGAALTFDGANDWIETSDFDMDNDFTISLWANPYTTPGQAFIGKHDSSGNNLVLFGFYGTGYGFYIRNAFFSSGVKTTGWQHLAVVGEETNGVTTTVTVYRNGEMLWQHDFGAVVGDVSGGLAWTIGQDWDPPSQRSDFFAGSMDEIRIWNAARAQEDIRADMHRKLTGDEPDLVAYWPFDEGSGSTVFDQTSNGYDGVLGGGVIIQRPRWIGGPFATFVYTWDTFASHLFGQSDDVIFRLDAYPQPAQSSNTGTYRYLNSTAGPYQWPYAAAATYPFRVRGAQVRVLSGTVPAANALVYRLPESRDVGGLPFADGSGTPFRTDGQGYLQGRGELGIGDRLMALLPITWTESYTLYYTSGAPTAIGVDAYTVTGAGVQTLTVSSAHPLILFNLDVALEWDAHNDAAYLEQLQFNLQRASEYLYDFTNGQMALGRVNVFQNADDWAYVHVTVRANNRLRPFAVQGGIVPTDTVDPQHPDIVYTPGQVSIGSTWNRYGRPGQSLGEDWPVILAHELSHYLLYHDDVYLGLDAEGHLIAVDTCLGSAMGDLYNDPSATEFIYDADYWQANCGETLPAKTLGRTEWETMDLWYPALVPPPPANSGPGLMPFELTTVSVYDPLTPTETLEDPTFYLDYAGGGVSSTEARAYLLREERYVYDLGSPFGGQNRVLAHGAQPGDRLCVFDRPLSQYGCEVIAIGDDQVQMEQDVTWTPLVQLTPVSSTTLDVWVESIPLSLTLRARLYPEYGAGTDVIALSQSGVVYSGTFNLDDPALSGHVQVWVEETATEEDPRRETLVAYSINGNPGFTRGGGGFTRGGGGFTRGGGGFTRGGGGFTRGGGAPLMSPDGQMIFFTENPLVFEVGQFYTIQGMAGLPPTPPGRTVIGQGYRLAATAGTPVVTGSVSIQYLSNDVLVAGADESGLTIYFHDGSAWQELPTVRNLYFNLVTAPSRGVGVYALMSSVRVPLRAAGWNLFAYPLQATQPVSDALRSIDGYYRTVYGYRAEDADDPWEVYQVGGPGYLNDLAELEPGRGYWISATRAITIHLSNAPDALMAADGLPASPPDTYYGAVAGNATFTPVVGMEVEAWIGGVLCGRDVTCDYGGQVVYVVDVMADDGVAHTGCGQLGRQITFVVAGQWMTPVAMWDNSQLDEMTLTPAAVIYLPLVLKNSP